jgi:adenosine deaminase
VSINSDDPPMFSTTLTHEYEVAAQLLGLDERGVADLAQAAVRDSFLPDADKRVLVDEIEAYAQSTPSTSASA